MSPKIVISRDLCKDCEGLIQNLLSDPLTVKG